MNVGRSFGMSTPNRRGIDFSLSVATGATRLPIGPHNRHPPSLAACDGDCYRPRKPCPAADHLTIFANPFHARSDFHHDLPYYHKTQGKAPQYSAAAGLPGPGRHQHGQSRKTAGNTIPSGEAKLPDFRSHPSQQQPTALPREGDGSPTRAQNSRSASDVGPAVWATGPDSVIAIVCRSALGLLSAVICVSGRHRADPLGPC